ncbi:MAG: Crp/Fnr family transcriptional regulator [Cyanobacteria bacterium J06576_12]
MTTALEIQPTSYRQQSHSVRRPKYNNLTHSVPASIESIPANRIAFKRHDNISFVNHSLWRIHSGYVRTMTWNAEGECVPLGFWSTGDVVGYPLAQTYPYGAECLTLVEAEYLSVSHPLSREMLLSQIRQSNSLLRIAHCRNSEQRILQFVCWLAEYFGTATGTGIEIALRLTHQEIADAIGTTRVTVTRLLKSLERKGHIVWKTQEKMVFRKTFEQCYVRSGIHRQQT